MLRIIAIIIATIALAYAAWANSAGTLLSKFSPERGLRLNPTSAQALINVTEKAKAKKDQSEFLKIARTNSVSALRSEPLSSRALRQLGVYFAMSGDVNRGRKLVEMSASLSRRDTPGQLWLATNYLNAGKSRDALQALDVVMRTQPETREVAFNALGSALADPQFRKIFVSYVRNKPSWLKPFIQFNVSLKQPETLSRTLLQMQPLSKDIFDDRTAGALLSSLVSRAPIEEARLFYTRMPGASVRALTSIEFARPADAFRFPPFGWEMLNDGNVQGFSNISDGVSIEALAVPNTSGTAARKLLFLRPGTYHWSGSADLSAMTGGGSTSINLQCNIGPGRWRNQSNLELKSGRNQFSFDVPPSCSAQLLTIDIAGPDAQNDVSMRIEDMRLVRGNEAGQKRAVAATTAVAGTD